MRAFIGDEPEIEYLAGRAVAKMSPKHRHAVIQGSLWAVLRRLGRGYGTVGTEWRFRLSEGTQTAGKTHLVPDVAFVSYERWRPLSDPERQEPPFAPDVAIEVRSPGDRNADVMWKIRAYLDAGASLVLDVFPEQRRIVAYAAAGALEYDEGDCFECSSVPWLRFDVREAFADLEPGE